MAISLSKMLEFYRISPITGFAMEQPSAITLANPALRPWMEIGERIPEIINAGTLRLRIRTLPVLSSDLLQSFEEYRLAFVVLTFLAQAYIWGNHEVEDPENSLPPSISVPLLEIAEELEVQPAYCYVASSVWLYTKDADTGVERCICSFTGTKDEEHFNLTTHNVERIGGRALTEGLLAARFAGQRKEGDVIGSLERMTTVLQECKAALKQMRNGCDPDVFYFRLRPYLMGSQSVEGGVRYCTSDTEGTIFRLPGTSVAQSSLFQALDFILGVSHSSNPGVARFIQEMQKAMPGSHARFLEDIKSLPSISKFIESLPYNSTLRTVYNNATQALAEFRTEHIGIVASYILSPSRKALEPSDQNEQPKEGSSSSDDLMKLLKIMRDDTKQSAMKTG